MLDMKGDYLSNDMRFKGNDTIKWQIQTRTPDVIFGTLKEIRKLKV